MNKKQAINDYFDYIKKIKAYYLVLSTTYFDRLTIAPIDGNEFRNEMLSIIDGETYSITTNKEFIELVNYLKNNQLTKELDREISLAAKDLENVTKFTKEQIMEFSSATMKAFDSWYNAKKSNKYSIFKKDLLNVIELSKQRCKIRNNKVKPYDLLLDDYEEGMDTKQYDEFFKLIKKELLPLIKKINNKQDYIDDSFLYKYYPKDKQELFLKKVMEYLNFDPSWGYMGVSEHPFTNGLSRNDVRVTTSYDEYNISSSIFSLIHECGHAFYEHQVSDKYDKYLYLHSMSSGMHESQSRFFENYLARKESFFKNLYPYLQELFPENLKDVSLKDFIKAINVSKSSFIRTEADELTYPIHVLIRYEIEKDIFAGKVDLNNLDKVWNKKYKDYLGVDVKKDSDGILQDVHWSDASFGYFPTYALGSAIGAQIFAKMNKDLRIDELLENNKFNVITDYLKNNIQKYGALYTYNEILLKATGKKFNPKYYIDYLKKKYSKLYNIK